MLLQQQPHARAAAAARQGGSQQHRSRPRPCLARQQQLPSARSRQQQLLLHLCAAASPDVASSSSDAGAGAGASYEWSWQQGRQLPREATAFDAQHPLPEQPSAQDVLLLLGAASASVAAAAADMQQAAPPSQAWLDSLLRTAAPLLVQLSAADATQALQALAQLGPALGSPAAAALLQQAAGGAAELGTRQLAQLAWAASELALAPTQAQWEALLGAARASLQDFYGPDFATLLCAVGGMYAASSSSDAGSGSSSDAGSGSSSDAGSGSSAAACMLSLPPGWADAAAEEAEYQLAEFVGDLAAFDLARLASGLADLGISPGQRLQERLLKAVYMRTRSIEEKGAVDFALSKLDARGKRSMHYDPRWTHEELKWLPRRERDKRRILKEGWYRTRWSGWRPDGGGSA